MPQPYVEFPSDNSPPLTCCQRACPVGTDVANYVALIAQGRFSEALAIVRRENPFPSICGRVCDPSCEVYCRRADSDQPVAIRALKRFLADRERAEGVRWPEPLSPTRPQKVAIIGAGPAGLTAASDLLRAGFGVTVFESLSAAGGMMRVGIPDYRLPPDVLDFDLEYLSRLGIQIRLNTALGRDFTLSELKAQGYLAVLLATGAHGSRQLKVKGSELAGVMLGIDFLRKINLGSTTKLGRRVIVIGGGDVAMDTARTALRLGAGQVDVFCLESRDEIPAHDWEMREALDENIRFNCQWGPAEIVGDDRVRQVRFIACTSVFDSSGKFAPTFDLSRSVTIDTDNALIAIGQVAQFSHAPEDGIETGANQLYCVDPLTLQSTASWVFAAGDATYGTATVIQAIASGHTAAASICEYLQGRPLTGRWEPVRDKERVQRIEIPPDWEELPASEEPELPVKQRVRSFSEVKPGLTEAVAIAEAGRCMRCDYETKSHTYSRDVREQIYHLARDIGDDETAGLKFLQHKLLQNLNRPRPMNLVASFDDLVFLPANLTRLVIDPYREQCNTLTVIGATTRRPLEISGPVLIGGLSFSELSESLIKIFCNAVQSAEIALRVPFDTKLPIHELQVIRVVPLGEEPKSISNASALELMPEDPSSAVDSGDLLSALKAYRTLAPHVPIGVSLGPDRIACNVQAAVEAGLDFVMLHAIRPTDMKGCASIDQDGPPQISVLAEAVGALRAINREEDIDILYFGGIRGGGDAAKALALGAKAVMIGQAGIIAAGACQEELQADQGADRVTRFVQAIFMETSILARSCGKTDVHNLEPEDLRALSVETSRATGIPLAGTDKVYSSGDDEP